jgi:hypothetical protein
LVIGIRLSLEAANVDVLYSNLTRLYTKVAGVDGKKIPFYPCSSMV